MRQHKKELNEHAFSILTLDDDPIMTSTIQAYFQRAGYRVDVENDPHRAIERIRQGSYDILLLDFLMTPICGDQVVEQIRQFNTDLYIILLTGHKSMAPPIKTIRELDIQCYFEKSDRFDQLELLVETCVKSIRQMRTIRSYKDGLSTIVDSMPEIYDLSSVNRIVDSILHTAASLLPCQNVILSLDSSRYQLQSSAAQDSRFTSRALGDDFTAPPCQEIEEALQALDNKDSLIRDKQMFLPIVDGEQNRVGLLTVSLKNAPQYNEIQLLEVFARQASAALSNMKLHSLLQETNLQLNQAYGQLQNSYLEMISTMRSVVDAKDTYTRGHSDRVSYYASQIAQQLGKDAQYCERVRIAGLFHDVGKLSIPDDILLKPDRLTDEEYQVIKSHPRNGVELLSVITQFRPILPAILCHHERLDGSGYPEGLHGEEIPEEARIIAVADTFDAMTSDRLYRKATSFQQALDELEKLKGIQLDSQAVDAFRELICNRDFWKTMREQMAECAPSQAITDAAL